MKDDSAEAQRRDRPQPIVDRLRYDRRGAVIIEFAIVGPVLIALIIATIETGLTYFSQESLETAAELGLRTVATGATSKAKLNKEEFTRKVCGFLPDHMKCERLTVDVVSAPTLGATNAAAFAARPTDGNLPANTAFKPGGPGDVIILRLFYAWPTISGPLNFTLANMKSGERLLVATKVARAEPYQL